MSTRTTSVVTVLPGTEFTIDNLPPAPDLTGVGRLVDLDYELAGDPATLWPVLTLDLVIGRTVRLRPGASGRWRLEEVDGRVLMFVLLASQLSGDAQELDDTLTALWTLVRAHAVSLAAAATRAAAPSSLAALTELTGTQSI